MTDPLVAYPLLSFFVPAAISWLAYAPDVIAAYRHTVHMGVFMSCMRKCIDARDLPRAEALCGAVMNPYVTPPKEIEPIPSAVFVPAEFKVFLERMRTDGVDSALSTLESQLILLRGKRAKRSGLRWLRRTTGDFCMFLSFWVTYSWIHASIFHDKEIALALWLLGPTYILFSLMARSMRRAIDRQYELAPYALSELAYRIAAQKPPTP